MPITIANTAVNRTINGIVPIACILTLSPSQPTVYTTNRARGATPARARDSYGSLRRRVRRQCLVDKLVQGPGPLRVEPPRDQKPPSQYNETPCQPLKPHLETPQQTHPSRVRVQAVVRQRSALRVKHVFQAHPATSRAPRTPPTQVSGEVWVWPYGSLISSNTLPPRSPPSHIIMPWYGHGDGGLYGDGISFIWNGYEAFICLRPAKP